jgi:hypothetical protein
MPTGATFDIKRDNNIAQRNVSVLETAEPATLAILDAIVVGTSDASGIHSLVIDRSLLPDEARVIVCPADDERMENLFSELEREEREPDPSHAVQVLTRVRVSVGREDGRLMIRGCPGSNVEWIGDREPGDRDITLSSNDGIKGLEIDAAAGAVELPLLLAADEFTPLLVAVLRNGADGDGELRLTQRRGDGELSEGFSVLLRG